MKQRILYQWDYWVEDVVLRNRRMKTNSWGEGYFSEGHNMINKGGVLYKEDYKDEHPEWFSKPYGGYDYHDIGQLCVTNEEATEEFIRRVKEMIMEKWGDGSNSYFMIGMEDAWDVCKCATCTEQKEINATDSGNFIVFTNKVSKAVNEWVKTLDPNEFPNCTRKEIYFPIYAYFYNEAAPVKEVNGEWVPANENVIPEKHVIIMYAPLNNDWSYSFDNPKNVKTNTIVSQWLKVTKNMMVYSYCVPYGATGQIFLPFNDLATMGGSYNMAKENNYLGYSEEGSTYYRYPCMQRLKNFVSAQMWWGEREGSVDDFAYEFIDFYYRPVAEEFKAYYAALKQWNIYQVEVMGCQFRAMSSSYGDEANWPIYAIDYFHGLIEDMLKKIEPLKETNPDLYQTYFDRINVEKLWTSYAYCRLYKKYFNQADYLKHVDFVAKYCVEYKVQTSADVFTMIEGWRK
jgi:hypothetical protein